MGEGEMIHVLIGRWIEYARLRSNHSIKDFASWLYRKVVGTESSQGEDEEIRQSPVDMRMEIGYLFGRLANFSELWGKLAFKDLPILQFEDFTILQEVKRQQNPTKKYLAELLVNEKSTAFEIIKRLVRDGLLSEKLDEKDRRIRRVQLTQLGEEVLAAANQQAEKVAILLMGDTAVQDMHRLINVFRDLNDFHTHLHEQVPHETVDDLVQLLIGKGK